MRDVPSIRPVDPYMLHQEFYRHSRRDLRTRAGSDAERQAPSFPYAKYANILYAETAAGCIATVVSAAKRLRSALDEVQSGSPLSALHKRVAHSSDESVLTAAAREGAPLGETVIEVIKLAQKQINSGPSFVRTSPTTLTTGFHRFSIQTGEAEKEISVYIYSADTNESALRRIRSSLLQFSSAIAADVVVDSRSNMIRLEVSSREPGARHAFSFIEHTGGLVAAIGIHLVDQEASNAEFRVNGGELSSSPANRVELPDRGLSVTLKQASSEGVRLSVSWDIPLLLDRMNELTEAVNGMKKAAEEAAGYVDPLIGRGVARALTNASLQPLGLSLSALGGLAFDPSALRRQIEHDHNLIEQSLDNRSTNTLPYRLDKLLRRLEAAPAEELLDRSHADFSRYANYSSTLQRYSQLPFHGVLMNREF